MPPERSAPRPARVGARRLPGAALLAALALGPAAGCAVLNAPLLAIHSLGMHKKTRAVDVAPFYTPSGRLAFAAEGRMYIEPEPGAEPVLVPDPRRGNEWLKSDDPVMAPDGGRIWFISGVEMHTAEGAHSDHVWQLYSMAPGGEDIRRESRSRRKESDPVISPDGTRLALIRRTEFRPYALDGPPWGRADVFLLALDAPRLGVEEDGTGGELAGRSLTGPVFDEYRGLAFRPDGGELAFGARNGDEPFAIWRLDLAGREDLGPDETLAPERWIEDASLPAYLPDGSGLVYVGREAAAAGAADAPAALGLRRLSFADGRDEWLGVPLPVPRTLAVSPDGTHVAFCGYESGKHHEYVLYELDLASGAVREVHRVLARSAVMFKPLDYIHPIY